MLLIYDLPEPHHHVHQAIFAIAQSKLVLPEDQ
jgi:hypothetical protein